MCTRVCGVSVGVLLGWPSSGAVCGHHRAGVTSCGTGLTNGPPPQTLVQEGLGRSAPLALGRPVGWTPRKQRAFGSCGHTTCSAGPQELRAGPGLSVQGHAALDGAPPGGHGQEGPASQGSCPQTGRALAASHSPLPVWVLLLAEEGNPPGTGLPAGGEP